ncbi:MAG: ECF transporter S component [Clostridia bacterium]|nr:ECF transporter S component [Clostridia bacterium]
MKANKLSLSALFCALTLISTMVLRIPSGLTGGYINLGDIFVLLSSYFLGPLNGAVVAALGSCFADIFTKHTIFALPTLIIKFFTALTAGLIFKKWHRKKFARLVICATLGECVMVFGYFLVDLMLSRSLTTALIGTYGSFIQAIFAIIVSAIFYKALMEDKKVLRYLKNSRKKR